METAVLPFAKLPILSEVALQTEIGIFGSKLVKNGDCGQVLSGSQTLNFRHLFQLSFNVLAYIKANKLSLDVIIFTRHSLLRLEQRGVSKSAVAETLKSPDYKIQSRSERIIAYKKFDKLYLKVIYKVEKDDIIIITQHWEEKSKSIK